MNYGQNPAGNSGFQLGGGDAPKQATTPFGIAGKPTFGVALGASPSAGFGGAPSSFNFGGSAAPASTSFSLSAPSSTPSQGFPFGASASAPATTLNFAPPAASQAPSFGFGSSLSSGAPAAPSVTLSSGLSLGALTTSLAPSAGCFSLGAPSVASTAVSSAPISAAPVPPFSQPVASSAPAASGFSFGAPTATPPPSLLTLGATTTSSAPGGFSVVTSAPTTTSSGFSLGVSSATPTTTSTAPTTTAAVTFNFPASSSTATPSFGATTTAAPQLAFNIGGTTTSTATTSATTPSTTETTASGPVASLNFVQLEETINKWTMDLEEQEKLFMLQATQVNGWDRTLTSNGEKIEALNKAVEAVKMEQQRLDNELEFICSQQRELEDCLIPLEKELACNAVTDPERENTYELAANMDTQLKQMSEDLKEIIENLNERNRAQDSSDPLVQIGRILNSHMDSLQWIEHNTHAISNHLDQVSKLHESHRRDNERSFHLTYD